MKPSIVLLSLIFTAVLGACSKVATPLPGSYRAYVETQGGEAPFQLQVSTAHGKPMLDVVYADEAQPATNLVLHDGSLQAELPQAAGTLNASLSRSGMKGELKLVDSQGKPQTLPFTAQLHKDYRFVERPSTDNADVSGYWQLQPASSQHFAAPVTLRLTQRFDAVDGQLLSNEQTLPLMGQVHGDEVYLSSLAAGRALLIKGKVDTHGDLSGELWINSNPGEQWQAKRMNAEQSAALEDSAESMQPVVRHWAVPQI